MRIVWPSAVVAVGIAVCSASQSAQSDSEKGPPRPTNVAALEDAFFAPRLTADEVRVLLGTLSNGDVREAAEAELAAKAQGHERLIAEFAAKSPDLEVREACAAIVATLDARWRDTEAGRELGEAYRQQGNALLLEAWATFRKNPLDPRAAAVLMALDPEAVWKWLSQRDDKLDSVRYLLLRLREASPDAFAQAHLFEHDGASVAKVHADVFPHSLPGRHHAAQRIVGHTAHRCIEVRIDETKSPATLALVELTKRRLYLFEHDWHRESGVVSIGLEGYAHMRGAKEIVTRPVVRTNESIEEDAADVPAKQHQPLLHLEQYHFIGATANHLPLPWWVHAYLPARRQGNVGERTVRFRGEQPPWVVPPAPPARTAEEVAAVTLAEWRPFVESQALTPEEREERRQLANAQIERGRAILSDTNLAAQERRRQAAPHFEAAVRLAPEDAAIRVEYCKTLRDACRSGSSTSPEYRKKLDDLAWATADCLLRFELDARDKSELGEYLTFSASRSPGIAQWPLPDSSYAGLPPHGAVPQVAQATPKVALSSEEFRMLEGARRIVEASFREPLESASHVAALTMMAYRGMRAKGVPLEVRQKWLDRVAAQTDRQLARLNDDQVADPGVAAKVADLLTMRAHVAYLALDEGNPDRAWRLALEVLPRVPYRAKHNGSHESVIYAIRPAVDWRTRNEHSAWKSPRLFTATLVRAPIEPPRIEYAATSLADQSVIRHKLPASRGASPISPVAVVNGRLYAAIAESGQSQVARLATIPLRADGRPDGQAVPAADNAEMLVWDTVRFLPEPQHPVIWSSGAAVIEGRLCFADRAGGIAILDTQAEKWSRIERPVEDRLGPIYELHPIDGTGLYCTAGVRDETGRYVGVAHLVVDVRTREVKSLRRVAFADPHRVETPYSAVWKNDGKWIGLGRDAFRVDLLGKEPSRIAIPLTGIHGAEVISPQSARAIGTRLGDRWYVNVRGTLHEYAASGEIRRSWLGSSYARPARPLLGDKAFALITEGGLPVIERTAAAGSLLLFSGPGTNLIAFDPRTETLYGPFDAQIGRMLSAGSGAWISGSGNGVWIAGSSAGHGMAYVTADDLIAAARKGGSVTPLAQYARRVEEATAKLHPLPRATIAYAAGRYADARAMVETALAAPPKDPAVLQRGRPTSDIVSGRKYHESQALFLLACLCGPDALDDTRTYLECAANLSGVDDRNSAALTISERSIAFTGMYLEFCLHRRNEDWPKTRIAAERILARFPYIVEDLRNEVNAGYEESRRLR